jgi:hypothetical protein
VRPSLRPDHEPFESNDDDIASYWRFKNLAKRTAGLSAVENRVTIFAAG